jgi:hypothetical protein
MIPEFLVDDEEVLPVGLSNMNLAHVAEIGYARLRRIENREGQRQEECGSFHARVEFPSEFDCAVFFAES